MKFFLIGNVFVIKTISLSTTTRSSILLDDDNGLTFNSTNNTIFYALGGIYLDAPYVNFKSPLGEIRSFKMDTAMEITKSSVSMCSRFDIKGINGTILKGTIFVTYEPFDDAPVEKSFAKSLFGNIMVGLAVVGLVCLTVATLGASTLVVAGVAAVGIGAVAIKAGGDVISREVSSTESYIKTAFDASMTAAVFAGIGVAGQAFGKGIKCLSNAGKVLNVTSKVSGGVSIAMDGFDLAAMGWGHFDPDNPLTALNQYLHGNKYYNYFQLGTNMLAVFTGAANSTKVCFVAGTQVLTTDGLVSIEEIKASDKVISKNPETFKVEEKSVIQTYRLQTSKIVNLTIDGELIQTTAEHPFYVKDYGFINAEELKVGNELLDINQNICILENIEIEIFDNPVTVYNFEVEDFHIYHVGQNSLLVHNANCKPQKPKKGVIKTQEHLDGSVTYTKIINGKEVSVTYSSDGYPDFLPHAEILPNGKTTVNIEYTGSRDADFKLADKMAGYTRSNPTPKGLYMASC